MHASADDLPCRMSISLYDELDFIWISNHISIDFIQRCWG